jgi:hypothetical protein
MTVIQKRDADFFHSIHAPWQGKAKQKRYGVDEIIQIDNQPTMLCCASAHQMFRAESSIRKPKS